MEYKISEAKEDPKDSIIEKTGHVIRFTLNNIERDRTINDKTRREITAKRLLEHSKAENIEHHHAFVKEMSEEDLHTAHMYWEAKELVKMCDAKLEEFDTNEAELKEELADLVKQLPELAEAVASNEIDGQAN